MAPITSVAFTCVLAAAQFLNTQSWSNPKGAIQTSNALEIDSTSRRTALERVIGGVAGAAFAAGFAPPAALAAAAPSAAELSKLQRGHARIRYLLENWDALTSICGTRAISDTEKKQVIRTEGGGGGTCEKTPLRVQEFLGYKSTEDPLFKADKLMVRAAPLVDPDDFEAYLDTIERYREKADQGAMMAYTSSWGEANPNGGKEVIDAYLERTKEEVILTEGLLRKVLGYLGLDVLPPQK